MRGLQVTLFVLGMLVLGTQTFRHIYVKWIAPRTSVLDAYKTETEEEIAASDDLEELVALYDEVWKKVQEAEKSAPDDEPPYARMQREPYRSEQSLRQAILRWEDQSRSITELRFYWFIGLLSIAVGVFAYLRVNRWLGMVGLIAGFTEMGVWTSPLWRSWGPQAEFERLLNQKLLLSAISVILLVALWLWHCRGSGRNGTVVEP